MSKIGNKNNNNTSVPTQEEYIAQQITAKRAAALDKSRNRTSVRIPMVPNKRPIDVWEGLLNNNIKYAEESLSRAMAEGNKKLAALKQEELDSYLKEKDAGYPKLVPGANCMYNAGDCYGLNIPGNQTFVAKHKELGFKKAPKGSMEPGDIVQDVRGGTPIHAMIYDSKDAEGNLLFNYAKGNGYADLENGYVKQGNYPLPIKDFDVYKYVGTPADSTQWINEYKQRYGNGMRCGGERKSQVELDIREGGMAQPIANNMWYIHGRKHEDGGVTMGPNNKNGAEVEGGEVVEMIDSNHPSVGRQFAAGGQNQTMRVFSSVPFLRGVSPAQLVMGGANPDAVFKAQEEFKDRNRINDDGTMYKTGGIHIKPSKRGTFTAAATKRGMGVQEFANKVLANKEDYSPAMVKKANFARNASRWKKEYGGDDTKTAALKRLRNKFTIRGNYDGGMFGGAGAGSVIMAQPEYVTDTITKRYLVPVTQNFNDAFGDAVNAGLDKFMFDKKWYTTEKGNNPNNNAAGAARTQTVYLPVEHKEVRRRKKEFGGMIYEINGNVRNGLSLRSKAKYGKINRNNKDEKVGSDGLIYKRAADGEWYTDGTVHVAFKKANPIGLIKPNLGTAKEFNYIASKPKRVYIEHSDYEEEKETKKIGSLTYEKNKDGKWVPSVKQSTTATRDGGRPNDFGMIRTGVNHPNGSYKYHPLTGEKISEMGVVETSEPTVKGTTKVSSSLSSTPRGRGTKVSTPKSTIKTTAKGADTKYGTPLAEKKESLYMTGIKNNSVTPLKAGMEKIKSPSSTGGGTQSTDGRWIGQYKTTNVGDWIGLGSNLAGSVASYFMAKNAINKMPEPIKPVMAQAAKLKTRYNVEPQLTELREAEQMNRAAVRRNTQSSNISLAREQRFMNEARGARNTLYGQKENIETQLINQDRLNRQSVMRDNVRAYNEYLNRVTATKMAQNEMRASNINNLISGLTGSVNNILGNIESRRATNNTLRAIAAANPNVDARLIGGFDYYIDPITKKKYNKNQQYIGTING